MDFNIDIRRIQLDSLEQLIASSKEKVQGVLQALEWDSETILKDNKFVTCSLDTNHKVPQKSADCHIRKCALRKEGYDLNELFLSEPLNDSRSSVTIDDHRKIEILSAAHKKSTSTFKSGWNGQDPDPKTYERLMTTFSGDERLALYDYAVKQTNGPDILPEYDVTHRKRDETKPLTYEDQLARERDAKRRRLKYKSVHTSRKSHTEVLREVIESQMGLYSEWLTEKPEEKPVKTPREPEERPISRNSSTSKSSSKSRRKEVKRELSDDTESLVKSMRNSVENVEKSRVNNHYDEEIRRKNCNEFKSRYKEEVRERFEVRREDFRRRERSRDRREYRHERLRRSRSRERKRVDDNRRNGCNEYRS